MSSYSCSRAKSHRPPGSQALRIEVNVIKFIGTWRHCCSFQILFSNGELHDTKFNTYFKREKHLSASLLILMWWQRYSDFGQDCNDPVAVIPAVMLTTSLVAWHGFFIVFSSSCRFFNRGSGDSMRSKIWRDLIQLLLPHAERTALKATTSSEKFQWTVHFNPNVHGT